MKIRLIDREVVDGRPRLTIQTRRWWQWRWRTEVWLRFAVNEEKRTSELVGDNVVPIRREA